MSGTNTCPISSMYYSSPLNTQVLFYDGHVCHYDDRELTILQSHHIKSFILKTGESMNEQTNNNVPTLNLKNLYGNTGMN